MKKWHQSLSSALIGFEVYTIGIEYESKRNNMHVGVGWLIMIWTLCNWVVLAWLQREEFLFFVVFLY